MAQPSSSISHFLDTSVARSLLSGSDRYKTHLREGMADGSLLLSKYARMELIRSYVQSLVSYYFVLDLPTINSVDDANRLWANRFRASELKAVLQTTSAIFNRSQIDTSARSDKKRAVVVLGAALARLEVKIRSSTFAKDPSADAMQCHRAAVRLKLDDYEKQTESLKTYQSDFQNVEYHQSRCRIAEFILERMKDRVRNITDALNSPAGAENKGFRGVARHLKIIEEKGKKVCTCHRCKMIGDGVIALSTPTGARLECTDSSFDLLCPLTGVAHFKHISDEAYHKSFGP